MGAGLGACGNGNGVEPLLSELVLPGKSIRARGNKDLNERPQQLRLLIVAIEEKKLAKKRSPHMGYISPETFEANKVA